MRSASNIVRRVANSEEASVREIEAALFMWGYDVRSSNPYLASESNSDRIEVVRT